MESMSHLNPEALKGICIGKPWMAPEPQNIFIQASTRKLQVPGRQTAAILLSGRATRPQTVTFGYCISRIEHGNYTCKRPPARRRPDFLPMVIGWPIPQTNPAAQKLRYDPSPARAKKRRCPTMEARSRFGVRADASCSIARGI